MWFRAARVFAALGYGFLGVALWYFFKGSLGAQPAEGSEVAQALGLGIVLLVGDRLATSMGKRQLRETHVTK